MIKVVKYLYAITLFLVLWACKKGKGAICNDGWRSHSTGHGTCSWHGGINHYVNPNEIEVFPTILLCFFMVGALWFLFHMTKADRIGKQNPKSKGNQNNIVDNIKKHLEQKNINEKERDSQKQKLFKEIQIRAPKYQIELKNERGKFVATVKSQIYDRELIDLIRQLEVHSVWLNPLDNAKLNIKVCLDLFPNASSLRLGKYLGQNDQNFEITEVINLEGVKDLTLTGLSHSKFNLLIKGGHNLKQINFWKSEVRGYNIEELDSLNTVTVSDSIGIPFLKNLPALKILVIREGRYRKNDFDNIQTIYLKQLMIYNAKTRNIPDNFDRFVNLELKLLK